MLISERSSRVRGKFRVLQLEQTDGFNLYIPSKVVRSYELKRVEVGNS